VSDTPLTPDRLARIRALFDEALERTEADREGYLRRACGDDGALFDEVTSLLEVLSRQNSTWGSPVDDDLARALERAIGDADHAAAQQDAVGSRIGAYEITRLIGMGGMGAVYEGVRADDQYRKRVALKFLRRGVEGDLAIRRFRYERQILANLNHRNIAALLDGGVTDDGQPYIVMEYVDGTPITQHAADRNLGVRARIGLLRQVCNAVQHAHQNLVVHRDLKPGNILVTKDGTVKLLDFGIARLLREAEGLDQLPATQGGAQAFTPDYASPEQVRGLPVGTPSDVYSLGVIACELLSGHRPFALNGRLFSDLQTIIGTTPAPAPSTLVTDTDAPHFGASRANALRRQLAGDLDAIVLQALRKEPERRYGSADQLAVDLQRFLDGQPVSAQRDRFGYRAAKFLRRRRIEVAAGVLVLASLTTGMVTARAQARRADLERTKAEQANQFLSTMLSAVDPGNEGPSVTVAQMLSQAARDVETQVLDPEVEAQVRHTLGQTYIGLGMPDSAAVHVARAVALRQQVYGESDPRTARSLSYLAGVAEARGEWAVAESIGTVVLDIQRRLRPRNLDDLATAYDNLSRFADAQGLLDSSMVLQQQAIAIRREATDSASRASLPYSLNNLAVGHMYRGEFAQAESLVLEALRVEASVRGPESLITGSLLRQLAAIEAPLGRPDSAYAAIRSSIAVLGQLVDSLHPEFLSSQSALAGLRNTAEDWPATEAAARTVVNAIGSALHESNPQAAVALQYLGLALAGQGRTAAADSALEASLALRERYLPAEHWAIASSQSVLGYHYGRTARGARGIPMLRRAYAALVDSRGADAAVTRLTAKRLGEVLALAGNSAEAARWQATAEAEVPE
jgi:eukaryotic-like serine/threonine-protein kinase